MKNEATGTPEVSADAVAGAPPEEFTAYEAWRQTGKLPEKEVPEAAEDAAESGPDSGTGKNSQEEDTDASEGEDADAGAEDAAGEDDEPEQEEEPEAKPKPKRGGFQRRLDKLTREKNELRAKLEALEAKLDGAKPAGTPEAKTQSAAADRPKPEDFESYDEYTEALTDWKVARAWEEREKKDQARSAEDAAAEAQRKRAEAWAERADAFQKEHPDYDDVMEDAEDLPIPAHMSTAIAESEYGPAIAYHLAKNREEAKRLAALNAVACVREIGKIEARLEEAAKKPAEKPKPAVTKAPKPVVPVSAGTAGGTPTVFDDADDYTKWERQREAQLKRK